MAVQLLIHMIYSFKSVAGIQGGRSWFLSSQVLWYGLLPAVPDPKAANELFVTWSVKSLIVNRENIFNQILGSAIAIELGRFSLWKSLWGDTVSYFFVNLK